MRLFGLIGFPIKHSASPGIFSKIFRDAGLKDCEYRLFPIERIEELQSLLNQNPFIQGLNVTIPYKKSVIPLLDKLDGKAAEIGAVNVVKVLKSKDKNWLIGHNTDYYGFKASFRDFIKEHSGLQALILGSGGSSRVVQYALAEMKVPFRLVTRNAGEGSLVYEELNEGIISSHKIIINTTPLGMSPGVELFPQLPYNYIGEEHFLFDLIYNPVETMFLKKGRERGAHVKNGLEMLHIQAEKAWEIWNKS